MRSWGDHTSATTPEIKDRPVCTQARLNSNAPSAEIHNDVNDLLQSLSSIYQIKTDVLERFNRLTSLKTNVTSVQSTSRR